MSLKRATAFLMLSSTVENVAPRCVYDYVLYNIRGRISLGLALKALVCTKQGQNSAKPRTNNRLLLSKARFNDRTRLAIEGLSQWFASRFY